MRLDPKLDKKGLTVTEKLFLVNGSQSSQAAKEAQLRCIMLHLMHSRKGRLLFWDGICDPGDKECSVITQ